MYLADSDFLFDQTTSMKFYWVCLQDYIALLKAWYNETFMHYEIG